MAPAVKPMGDWIPREDYGLGLCYQGVRVLAERELERRKGRDVPAGFTPNLAVTSAPYPFGGTALALPVCFGCLTGSKEACGGLEQRPGAGLIVPNGRSGL